MPPQAPSQSPNLGTAALGRSSAQLAVSGERELRGRPVQQDHFTPAGQGYLAATGTLSWLWGDFVKVFR